MNRSPTGNLKVTAPSDLEIVMTREFDAPRALVFDAFTKPEHLQRWYGLRGETMPVCEVDLRVGGKWRFVLQMSGNEECIDPQTPQGSGQLIQLPELQTAETMGIYGEFLEIDPPSRLVQTEIFDEPLFGMMGGGSVNTMVLEERDGKTLMTLTALYKTKEARDAVLRSPMEQGAAETFDRLEELLRTLL